MTYTAVRRETKTAVRKRVRMRYKFPQFIAGGKVQDTYVCSGAGESTSLMRSLMNILFMQR
jgi:hypothetical protein